MKLIGLDGETHEPEEGFGVVVQRGFPSYEDAVLYANLSHFVGRRDDGWCLVDIHRGLATAAVAAHALDEPSVFDFESGVDTPIGGLFCHEEG